MNTQELTSLIRQYEEQLLQPHIRRSATAVADLLADEFIEHGRSGHVYTKQQVVASLQKEHPATITVSAFTTIQLAPGVILATYRSTHREPGQPTTYALRCSIWKQIAGRWQMVFHQGTPTGGNAS